MGADTDISWATDTFNIRWGCTKVSDACEHCYAESWAKRTGKQVWGADADRMEMSDRHWREPLRWQREAAETGRVRRVFCSSMADVFEAAPAGLEARYEAERARLWELIGRTPRLIWMLLTKRPQNIRRMVPAAWLERHPDVLAVSVTSMTVGWDSHWPSNVSVGTTVEQQRWANVRIPLLLRVPAPVRFVSMEPLLEPVSLARWLSPSRPEDPDGQHFDGCGCEPADRTIDWVIVGGESGPHSRPMHPDWVRQLRDQTTNAGIPYHFKQRGEYTWDRPDGRRPTTIVLAHPDGNPEAALPVWRLGKAHTGRLLDDTVWDQFPDQHPPGPDPTRNTDPARNRPRPARHHDRHTSSHTRLIRE